MTLGSGGTPLPVCTASTQVCASGQGGGKWRGANVCALQYRTHQMHAPVVTVLLRVSL